MSQKKNEVQEELQKRLREQQKLSEAIFQSLSQKTPSPKSVDRAMWPDRRKVAHAE